MEIHGTYHGETKAAVSEARTSIPFGARLPFFIPSEMKKLWVSARLAESSMETKVSVDALALNLLIKRMFVSSCVKDATTRRLMSLFHVSYKRMTNAVEEGIRRGWLMRHNGSLLACRVHFEKEYSVSIETTEFNPECPIVLTLTQMGNLLREAVIYNHISKQNDLSDTIRLATDPKAGELKAHRKARKRLLKKGMRVDSSNASRLVGLSYARICRLVNASRTKVKSIVKSMCKRGFISVIHRFEEAGIPIEDFTKQMQKQYSQYAPGFMILMDGLVHIQLANAYTANNADRIKLFY